jgi:hypothetical protein
MMIFCSISLGVENPNHFAIVVNGSEHLNMEQRLGGRYIGYLGRIRRGRRL